MGTRFGSAYNANRLKVTIPANTKKLKLNVVHPTVVDISISTNVLAIEGDNPYQLYTAQELIDLGSVLKVSKPVRGSLKLEGTLDIRLGEDVVMYLLASENLASVKVELCNR